MSIASNLMDQLLRLADEHHVERFTEVEVVCGVMQQVVPEALETAFEVVAAGTPAEGARLMLTEEPVAAQCRQCGERFTPTIDNYLCPSCQVADVEILAGKDLILKSVAAETLDKAST